MVYSVIILLFSVLSLINTAKKADTALRALISWHNLATGAIYDLKECRCPKRHHDGYGTLILDPALEAARLKEVYTASVKKCGIILVEYGWS